MAAFASKVWENGAFRERFLPVAICVLACCLYLVSKSQQSGDTAPNQFLPISILQEGNMGLDEYMFPSDTVYSNGLPEYWARKRNGNIVSLFPVIPGILNLPVFAAAKAMGVNLLPNRVFLSHVTAAIITAASVYLMYLFMRKMGLRWETAVFFECVYAFATCAWSVAATAIWQHGPSLFLYLSGILLLLHQRKDMQIWAGFVLSVAVINRPTNVILCIPIGLYVLLYKRQIILPLLATAAFPFVLSCVYSAVYWGSPLASLQESIAAGARTGPGGFLGYAEKILGHLFSPSRGLISMSPIFIFAFLAWGKCLFDKTCHPLIRLTCLAVPVYIIVYARAEGYGGWTFGYRYLVELLPFLTLLLAMYWETVLVRVRAERMIFFFFLAFSVYVQFLGAFLYGCGFNSTPTTIIESTERYWHFNRSELTLCTRKLFMPDAKPL